MEIKTMGSINYQFYTANLEAILAISEAIGV